MSDQPIPVCDGQLDIFSAAEPRRLPQFQRHSETSRLAAVSMLPNVATNRDRVYRFICDHWPCTDLAIEEGLKMKGSSVRPRRIDLVEDGLVVADGQALTPSGRKATTWRPA